MAKRDTEAPTDSAASDRYARVIRARRVEHPEAPRYHAPALRLMLVREAPGAYRDRLLIDHPSKAAAAVKDVLGTLAQERFVVLLLNIRSRLLGVLNVSEGSLSSCSADPKVIFSSALLISSPTVLLAHNHPSGDPSPSHDDRNLTRQLVAAGRLLGIRITDHVIIAGDEYRSLWQLNPELFR